MQNIKFLFLSFISNLNLNMNMRKKEKRNGGRSTEYSLVLNVCQFNQNTSCKMSLTRM